MIEPEAARPRSSDIESRYRAPILRLVEQIHPEQVGHFREILSLVDRQGIENWNFYEPQGYPGVRIPFTKVSVTEVATKLLGNEDLPPSDSQNKERKIFIVFPFWAVYPHAHPMGLWGETYDRVIKSLPSVVEARRLGQPHPEVEIYSLGLPHGFSGTLTPEWVDGLKKEGFALYGRAFADLFRYEVLQGNPQENLSITFKGASLAGVLADQTARNLPELDGLKKDKKFRLLLYIPAGITDMPKILRAIRFPLGTITDVWIRGMIDKNFRYEGQQEKPFLDKMGKVLEGRGVNMAGIGQRGLRIKEALFELKNLGLGSPLDPDIAAYIIRGKYDPVSGPPLVAASGIKERISAKLKRAQFKEKLQHFKKENTWEFVVPTSHYISYAGERIESWVRRMKKIFP